MPDPTVDDLADAVLTLRDARGNEARYVVDRIGDGRLTCSYVFRGRHLPPVDCREGEIVELGTGDPRGLLVARGEVARVVDAGGLTVTVDHVEIVQRRNAYREDIVLPLTLRDSLDDPGRRGRTENLSTGGFAGRVTGTPIDPGEDVLVTFDMPERDGVTVVSRKVGGDLPQRFRFVNLDRRTEERLARMVRAAELERRRNR